MKTPWDTDLLLATTDKTEQNKITLTPAAKNVHFDETEMYIDLADGRMLSVPIAWFPRLLKATPEQRNQWTIIKPGTWLHWEEIDEDIGTIALLGLS